MMLFWRGWGIAVFFLWIGCAALGMFAGAMLTPHGSADLDRNMNWGVALSFVVTAIIVLGMERYRARHPRKVVDLAARQARLVPHNDEFMHFRLRLWVYFFLFLAAVFVVMILLGRYPL